MPRTHALLRPAGGTKKGVGARVEKGQVQKGQRSIAKKKVAAARSVADAKTAAKRKPSSATKAKAAVSKGQAGRPAAQKRTAAAKSKAPARGKAPTKGRPPAKGKAKKTRGIQKKAPAAKVAPAAKPVAPKAPAAPGLRRNTTLQTRGKEEAGGLRPKSRTTGAPVGAKKPSPVAAPAAAKKPSPAQSAVPPAASAGGAAGSKRKAQAESAASANKRAKNAPASHGAASAPNAPASAAQTKSLPKARPSLGGAAASAAASGKTSQVGSRQDNGKAPIAQRDNAPADGSRSTQGAVAGATSKPSYGSRSAQEAGAAASSQTAHVAAELKQYHNYSHQGSRSVLRFVCAGDRREKKVPWEESEVSALADGVQKFNKSWAAILTAKSDHFHPSRNAVDLKDKWRNLQKARANGNLPMQFGGTVDKRIGQSIDVHWPGDGWYKGTIKQYVPAEGKYEAEFEEESGVSFVYFTGREVDRWAAGACGSSSANKAAKSQPANSTHFRKQIGGRKRMPWTEQEKDKLERGVKQYGPKWTQILLLGGFHECRTTMDLKDKWRNLSVPSKSA